MKLPTIAIVGRPNVGKSTLFNILTKSRDALVLNKPGVTRDRIYGEGTYNSIPFIVIDTGGLYGDEEGFVSHIEQQAFAAVSESDIVLFLVDARCGLTSLDYDLAQRLRVLDKDKKVCLVVNKIDGVNQDSIMAEFSELGLDFFSIAAVHNRGVSVMLEKILEPFATNAYDEDNSEDYGKKNIKFAIIGKPNVGKSTLVNRILGEERVVAYDEPGTTRDSIYIPFSRNDKHYTIIDTAGIRRKTKVNKTLEKFSVVKALQAVKDANVVIFVIDSRDGISDQDLHLLGFVLDAGRSLIIACNKWDGMTIENKDKVKEELDRRLPFVNYAKRYFISALHGSNVGLLFKAIDECYRAAMQDLETNKLTKILQDAQKEHQTPIVGRGRIKLKYAHSGGKNPPIIVIHGNKLDALPGSYKRYLENYFREALNMVGTPIRFEFKVPTNPFAK